MISNIKFQAHGTVPEKPLYRLKISLKSITPEIWRRVIVSSDMPLTRFHMVIQHAMGWLNYHLHQFANGGGFKQTYYGTPDPNFCNIEFLNEKNFTVADLAPKVKRKFTYEYDFGDSWQHSILVEKILPPDPTFKHPVCLAGENACPPEDCGGFGGYLNLLKIMSDPKHPEHKDLKGWIGGKFDPTLFDLNDVNSRLKNLKA